MERFRIPSIFLASVLAGAFCAPLAAQTVRELSPAPPREKLLPDAERPMLFSLQPEDPARADAIAFRSEEQMTGKDKTVAADAEASIGERAAFMGLEFNQGKWSYEQVVCPALPNHLFLKFLRNNGTGDVSMFSASIPRGDDGRVRIIPIQLRGYSLFSPAPINALTVSAFNHIRAEEHPDRAPDWLGTGLCYAALAGGHPQAAMIPGDAKSQTKYPTAPGATLKIPNGGGAVLSFTDVSASPRPMLWTMTFDRKGRLLKASHSAENQLTIRTEHPAPFNTAGSVENGAAPAVVKGAVPPTPAAGIVNSAPPPPAAPTSAPQYPAEVEKDVEKLKERPVPQAGLAVPLALSTTVVDGGSLKSLWVILRVRDGEAIIRLEA